MTPGKLILLNGVAGSGKSSIATALRAALPEPYLTISISDALCVSTQDTAPVLATQMVKDMHHSILALLQGGQNVIAEHTLCEPAWLRSCATEFYSLCAWFVGVRCPLAVLEQRARTPGRQPAQLQVQLERTHKPGVYDVEVDTSRLSPAECAALIQHRMVDAPVPLALSWLNAYTAPNKSRGWLCGQSAAPGQPALAA
jgi:chloramphenicol 3-O phosphotransferase